MNRPSDRSFRRVASAAGALVLTCFLVGGAPSAQAPKEQVRVPKLNANVHAGPSTASIVLVLVPQGTVLPVIERQGPWFQVELSPKLRQTAKPMRWFKEETRGFVHESTVEVVRPGTP